MFTPWNAKHIPLGPTPCNACPACPACPVGQNNRTGVNSFSACLLARSDRIGGDRLDLLNRGHVIPLGFGNSLSRYPIKLHQLRKRVELFYFVCRMKLVLSLDVGRWSRILRVGNNC